ncbi:MAG: hypothetical protein HPY74_15045 [Firmicutes bacterium]|nr:hypothetical protein [Bacillota bacterium]
MRDNKKAEAIAAQRVQLISPLLEEGLDPAKAKQIKARICDQSGVSERTLPRYLAQYQADGFEGLKPKGRGQARTEDAIPSNVLEQAILLRREVPGRSVAKIIQILEWEGLVAPGQINFDIDSKDYAILILSGQTPFITQLSRQPHEALRQRITVNYCLKGLTKDETREYVLSRLKIAGCHEPIFTDSALELMYSSTNGCIRPLNSLARVCLILDANEKLRSIDTEVVFQAQTELNITA